MPYGIPWPEEDYVVYKCVGCGCESDGEYTPFCPWCGEKQPKQRFKDAVGLSRLVRRCHEIEDVQAALNEFRDFAARLWRYSVSHCELQIVFYKTGGERMLLLCSGAEDIHISTSAWKPDLVVKKETSDKTLQSETSFKPKTVVQDRNCNYLIRCDSVIAYIGYDSSFCGDGLCES